MFQFITDKLLIVAVLSLVILVSGCASKISMFSAHITAHQQDVSASIDKWIEEQKYGKALKTIALVSPDHPQYHHLQKQKSEIKALSTAYEEQVLKKGQIMQKECEWAAALKLYKDALKRLPESSEISLALSALREKQQTALKEVQNKYLLAKGQWLLKAVHNYHKMAAIEPTNLEIARQLQAYRQQAHKTSIELAKLGEHAFKQGNSKRAHEIFTLSQRLEPNDSAQKYLLKLNRIQDKQAQFESKKRQRKRQRDKQALIKKIHLAEEKMDWKQLNNCLSALKRNFFDSQTKELIKKINHKLDKQIQFFLARGDELYSEGHYKMALRMWRQVLIIDPENSQADNKIGRAEQVIDNLERIREHQQTQISSSTS